jgi:hypothetical protein
MSVNKVILFYNDILVFEDIEPLLDKAKDMLDELDVKTVIKKKVFNVMVECIENIYKYSAIGVNREDTKVIPKENLPLISIEMNNNGDFVLNFGNAILNEKISIISQKNDHVNALDKQGLKMLYEEVINNTVVSDKGGAGLGTILSAMISGNKLVYSFRKIDDIYSYYILQITISNQKSS